MKKDILQELKEAQNSKSITLNDIQVTDEIWTEIIKLSHLEYLYFYNSNIGNVPDNISNLSKLKKLSLRECKLREFPINLTKLQSLTDIDIEDSNLKILPNEFQNFTNLEDLDISGNSFSEFPKMLAGLPKLKDLELSETNITNFSGLEYLINIVTLNISNNTISAISNDISNLSKLESLNLSKTQIKNFSWIVGLSNLKTLNLSDCKLSALPDQITSLINLQRIQLRNNKLNKFPKQLLVLTNITDIDLDGNNITELPKEISILKKLNDLDLDDNNLKSIPQNISLAENLEHINLRNNQIENLSTELFKLKNLRRLRLGNNQINYIPSEISQLINLHDLDLSRNKIKNVPHEISKLQNIRDIDLEDNPINALKFGYIISDKEHDFRYRFRKMRYKEEKDIFNFQELDYEINYGESFIFLRTQNSHAFIELIDHPGKLEMRKEFRKRDFYKSFRHGSGFVIYVFGETEIQKKILSDIRNHLDKWIKEENIEFDANRKGYRKEKFAFRFFYYPIHKKYEREIVIDYDKLLKYKEANQYAYFDDEWGEKFPVSDLLTYININDIQLDKKWKGINYLSQIKIKNLKLFENIEFKLSSKINILLGHNGLGKTSILQGITMGLLPIENIDKSDNFIEYIKFGNERTEIYINYGENEQRIVHVIPSGLSEMQHIKKPPHILLSYGVNLNADTKIDTKFYEQIIEGNAKSYSTKSIFKDYSNDFNDPLIILYELQKESKHKSKLKTIIKLIVDKINDYLNLISENEKIQLIEENGFFVFKDLNNNKLKLQNLSEGYKDHILLISDIVFRIISARNILFKGDTINENIFKKAKGVIIIDEFDRHLHPVWQRRLLIQLKKDFSNIQFILTTHNIFSLQSAVGATAHQILIKESGIHVESSKIKAENILSIIREFYTKDFFDYETQNELNLLSEYLDKIHDGKIDLVYSENFRKTVEKLNNMGEEIQSIIASQLLQLNSALKKIGKKEFVL